jgi:hypothetical protein
MISFWISVVPPKMDRTLNSLLGRAFITVAKITKLNSRMLKSRSHQAVQEWPFYCRRAPSRCRMPSPPTAAM